MQDRVSANPRRRLITPENGQPAFYATIEMADNPSVVGTALNKANLLTDATAQAMGLTSSATPNTAFAQLNTKINSNKTNADSRFFKMNWEQVGTADIDITYSYPDGNRDNYFDVVLSKNLVGATDILIEANCTVTGNPVTFYALKSSAGERSNLNFYFTSNENYAWVQLSVPRTSDQIKENMSRVNWSALGRSDSAVPDKSLNGLTDTKKLFFDVSFNDYGSISGSMKIYTRRLP